MSAFLTTPSPSLDPLEGNASLITPGLAEVIDIHIKPIMLERYKQGKIFWAIGAKHGERAATLRVRLMLQINVHATEIATLLKLEEVKKNSSNPKFLRNRPINRKHVEKIKAYIKERASSELKWILGTITVNVNPAAVE